MDYFDILPNEILINIFEFLPNVKDIWLKRRVCWKWNQIIITQVRNQLIRITLSSEKWEILKVFRAHQIQKNGQVYYKVIGVCFSLKNLSNLRILIQNSEDRIKIYETHISHRFYCRDPICYCKKKIMSLEMISAHLELDSSFIREILLFDDLTPDQKLKFSLRAVQINGIQLEHISDQTEEICLEAIRNKPSSFVYVKNQTDRICQEALELDPDLIKFIINQTEEMCIGVVEKNGMLLQVIRNRTPKVISTALKQNYKAERFLSAKNNNPGRIRFRF